MRRGVAGLRRHRQRGSAAAVPRSAHLLLPLEHVGLAVIGGALWPCLYDFQVLIAQVAASSACEASE